MAHSRARAAIAIIVGLATLAVAVLIIMFVWPTRYRYDHVQMLGETAPGPVFPVRIDRVTGHAEILVPQMLLDSRHQMHLQWVGLEGEPLPDADLTELRKSSLIDTEPLPFAQILNTTRWHITRVRWTVTSTGSPNHSRTAGTRQIDQRVFIEPNTLANVYLDLGRFGHNSTIEIAAAWGTHGTGNAAE